MLRHSESDSLEGIDGSAVRGKRHGQKLKWMDKGGNKGVNVMTRRDKKG